MALVVKSATASAQASGTTSARFRGGQIETVAPKLAADGERFEFVLVNPMRRSLGEECMRALAKLATSTLVYLAPAPRAGAEDIAVLARCGFDVRRVAAVNLHPGTSKVLMAVVMGRVSE